MHQDFPATELRAGKRKRAPPRSENDVNFEKFMLVLYTGSCFTKEKEQKIPSGFRKTWPMPKRDFSKERHRRFMETLASGFLFRSEEPETEKPSLWRQLNQFGIQVFAQLKKLLTIESKP